MKPHVRLAQALEAAMKVAREHVIHGPDLPQHQRTYLIKQGCLLEIMKGWYFLVPPDAPRGETALWHGSFWSFLSLYLEDRVGQEYCLSPKISLDLQSGETATPTQVIVLLGRGGNNTTTLRFADTDITCSLLTYAAPDRMPAKPAKFRGLNLMPTGHALARVTPTYFETNRPQAEVLLRNATAADLVSGILEVDKEAGAARVIGGLETLGMQERADQVRGLIALTGWTKAINPFPDEHPLLPAAIRPISPCADRIRLLWQEMRPIVLGQFPAAPAPPDSELYFTKAHELYEYDAYHSLSIEGFQVTPELIAKIAAGADFNDPTIAEENNRLAAKGYSLAHASVLESIGKMFASGHPGKIVASDLPYWYSELHRPFVQVGRISAADLAGYREKPVFIRGASHVPPAPGPAVIDSMEAFFLALADEPDAAVRAILGHFVFVYIHPFSDGNGRIGRFLMNAMLASGGYPWTIVRVKRRSQYLKALEQASTGRDIVPFTRFVAEEMAVDWSTELSQEYSSFKKTTLKRSDLK